MIKFRYLFFILNLCLFLEYILANIIYCLSNNWLQTFRKFFDRRRNLINFIIFFLRFLFFNLSIWFIKNLLKLKRIIIKLKVINLSVLFKSISHKIEMV